MLIHKLEVPHALVQRTVHFLRQRTIVLEVPVNPNIEFEDKKDEPILSLIDVAKANYFVTGDKKLLALKKRGQTLFLTPREAMEIL